MVFEILNMLNRPSKKKIKHNVSRPPSWKIKKNWKDLDKILSGAI